METQEIKLFYCYAHKEKKLLADLDEHLSNLKHQYNITGRSDREIVPGTDWKHEIDANLNTANIILLLISPSFIASNYCYGIEMERALKRHEAGIARVIPVILRPVDWQGTPLSKLQMLPTDAKPVTTWDNRDKALVDVANGIHKVVKNFIEQHHQGKNEATVNGNTANKDRNPGKESNKATHIVKATISEAPSMPVQEFIKNEQGYLEWIHKHPDGFVINTGRSKNANYMVLHRASCGSIKDYQKASGPGAFTERDYIKICGSDIASLRDWVRQNGRSDGTFSKEHNCINL